ncbi:MAG: hypothetical protein JO280_16325 [Mycobacteriaceae bacterium]|nr:hypothetical protein [Mycobacteriaceae bacterium]
MTTTIPKGGTREYLPDRYDRFRNAAEILASDPAVENFDNPLRNGRALRAYIQSLVQQRILDGLSERDADTAAGVLAVDFLSGPAQIAGRIRDRLTSGGDGDDPWAISAVLCEALMVYLSVLTDPAFQARRASGRLRDRHPRQ